MEEQHVTASDHHHHQHQHQHHQPLSSVQAAAAAALVHHQDQSAPIKVPFMDDFLKSDSNLSLERKLTLEKIMGSSGMNHQNQASNLFMSHLKQDEGFGQGVLKLSQESVENNNPEKAKGVLPESSSTKPDLETKSSCSVSQMKQDGDKTVQQVSDQPHHQVSLMDGHSNNNTIDKVVKEDLKQEAPKPFVDYLLGKSGYIEYPVHHHHHHHQDDQAMGSNIKLRDFICEPMNQASYTDQPKAPAPSEDHQNAPKDVLLQTRSVGVNGDNVSTLNKSQDEHLTVPAATDQQGSAAAMEKTGDNMSDYAPKAASLLDIVSNMEMNPNDQTKLASDGSNSLPVMLGNQLNDTVPKAT